MVEDTWGRREFPILEAAVAADAAGEDIHAAIAALPFDKVERASALVALHQAGYLEGDVRRAWGGTREPTVITRGVTERARRATGQWPSADLYVDLVQLIDTRISTTDNEEQKTKLQRLRDSVLGVGQGVATGVLTELVKRQTGLT